MIRSLFVPTPQVEQFSNYYLVQLLAKERVRCIMTGDKFNDTSRELVEKYLTIPPTLRSADEQENFFKTAARDIMNSFKTFEKTPPYIDALKALAPYAGNVYEVSAVTVNGIMVLITIPETNAA
jgi:hypothetical protein